MARINLELNGKQCRIACVYDDSHQDYLWRVHLSGEIVGDAATINDEDFEELKTLVQKLQRFINLVQDAETPF